MLKTIAVVTACGLAVAAHAAEQTFPTKPIRFIVPTATGGGSDPLARALGTRTRRRGASRWWSTIGPARA